MSNLRFLPHTTICRVGLAATALLTSACIYSAPSQAESATGSTQSGNVISTRADSDGNEPKLFKLTANKAKRIADNNTKVKKYLKRFKSFRREAHTEGQGKWKVTYYAGRDEVAQVFVDDSLGAVDEAWIGPQVAWTMARGVKGAFGRKVNEPIIWIPLMFAFALPFIQIRRPLSLINLDIAVLLSFSISLFYFNRGDIFTSIPLVYPPLIYLMARMLAAGFRRAKRGSTRLPDLLVPASWLALGLVFLIGFRVVLNVFDSNVIDVGYSGVIGAEKLASGLPLYGDFPSDNSSGDTYGPFAYLAYVPFELVFPWHGDWDSLPAAHAASIFFDLAMILGLYLVGARLERLVGSVRGAADRAIPYIRPEQGLLGRAKGVLDGGYSRLGLALAYGWAAYPYTLYVMNSNTNDTLMPMLLVFGFLALTAAPVRGALVALATFTKFAAAAVVPLWLSYRNKTKTGNGRVLFAIGFCIATFAVMAPVIFDPGLSLFWERTVDFQLGRESPFSIWGLHPVRYGALQDVLKVAVALLAVLVAFVPRQKDPIKLAALTAAIIIATQLIITHWFYLYIVWFFPFILIALLGRLGPRPQFFKETDSGDTRP